MAGDLKTREEYLIAYHDKLLAERKDTNDLINSHLIFAYTLLGLTIAIKEHLIVKLSAGGPDLFRFSTSARNAWMSCVENEHPAKLGRLKK